ncbi:ectonucleoside triphosphate diphosphohydrolase 6 isoform X2 [Dicentrarchus labrax]|uniref:ectonucleoside triphosphate diphosphohydrolase 6 isoform X2 n=1 Tax=Dicentrarchus labrax TaxID=13489 RepID=UPI0021F66F21|nr:ectonucleoside triphosphate diphosphohydrolase 6 isoform X2 [Dicentrarchus labrax]
MKRPKLAGVFLFVGCLLAYLMFVKRHYTSTKPEAYRLPPHQLPAAAAAAAGRSFQYGIMFDAGSTGTRVHIFKFQTENKEAPTLAHETFRAIKPGLSAYADDPEKCTAGIVELLEVAKSSVPPSLWTITPVVLKATAGLRLLPGEKAKHLLDKVRALFLESPFLSRDDSVSIMDGTDEGISAWITVNFLTGDLHRADSPTVGMLDLGGGSTQITFSPRDEKTIQTSPIDDIRSFRMFNNTHTVYTHSYLGLGLMSARLAVLGGVDASPLGGSSELVSPCLAPEYSGRWEQADIVYTVRGQKAGKRRHLLVVGFPIMQREQRRKLEEPSSCQIILTQPKECAAVCPSVLYRVRSSVWTWSTSQSCCRSSGSPPTNTSSWRGPSTRWRPAGLSGPRSITSSP